MSLKSATLLCRITPEMKQALEHAASRERRSVSSWVELTLEQVLIQRGFLARTPPRPIVPVKRNP